MTTSRLTDTEEFGADRTHFSKRLKDDIRTLTDADDSIEIWKWVHDEENRKNVELIAEAWLNERRNISQRAKTRQVESSAIRDEPAPVVYVSVEEKVAESVPAEVIGEDQLPTQDWLNSGQAVQWKRDNYRTYEQVRSRKKTLARAEERDARSAQVISSFRHNMERAMEELKHQIRVEWTEELLGSTFTLDGVDIPWGSATIEQHERRADALKNQAVGTLQTAGMHLKAAAELRQNNARNITEMMQLVG